MSVAPAGAGSDGQTDAVDPSGQTDSTAGIQGGIERSGLLGQCYRLGGGVYKISGQGLHLRNGDCFAGEGPEQAVLVMATPRMTGITIEGYHNRISGFLLTKAKGIGGGIGVLLDAQPGVDGGNTADNDLSDLWIVADDPVANLLTGGVKIEASAAGEVVFTHMRNIHVQGAEDGIWIESPSVSATHFQSNANWCTDCHIENSRRCLRITSTGENHFDGLSLNGCSAQGNPGTISVVKGSTMVVGDGTQFGTWPGSAPLNGSPLYVDGFSVPIASNPDATHVTLAVPWPGETAASLDYAVGLAPIVFDSAPDHYPVQGNFVSWNTGEPNWPVVVFDRHSEQNTVLSSAFAPLGATSIDLSGGKNAVISTGGNLLPSYDLHGFPQLWIGQVQAHSFGQYATLHVSESSPPGHPGGGNNDLFRIQRAATPGQRDPIGGAWLDFNPYSSGLYVSGASNYAGSTLKIDTARTDSNVSGSIDLLHNGRTWAMLQAVSPDNSRLETEIRLSAVSDNGQLREKGAIATRTKVAQQLSLGEIQRGQCGSAEINQPGAAPGDSIAPAWPAAVFVPGVVGSMTVAMVGRILVTVCNFSASSVNASAGYGAAIIH